MTTMTKPQNNKEAKFIDSIAKSSSYTLSSIDFIKRKQELALKKLEELGFPNRKNEDWKYFDFTDILSKEYTISGQVENSSGLSTQELNKLVDKYVYRETVDQLLVTVNGAYSPQLSNFNFNDSGIHILNFNDPAALTPEAQAITQKMFASNLEGESKYFKAINTLLMTNGFLLYLEDDFHASKPLQILHISNQNNFNQMRSLIYAGKNSKLDIIVNYIGLADSQYLTNAVIELNLEQGAQIKLDKIQNESKQASCLYTLDAKLSRNSNFEFNSFSFGAKSSRDDITVDINAEGAHTSVNGLYVLNQERKSHHKVRVNHRAGHSTSEQLFKGLLQGKSRAEFNGLIEVYRDAQQTNATQLNKNLLLSKDAHIDSRPQLNILADDVKCSHGSTVGSLSADELFYLQSRGLDELSAKAILTYSFARELISKIAVESAQNYATNLAFSSLRSQEEDSSATLDALADNNRYKKARYQQN
jgi:Fe-S cluster assembly protein SufD